MEFHEKLYGLRKQAGMTQSVLAEKLNVSRQAVSRWEMGTAKPEVDTLIAISDLFGVSLDYLLRDKTEQYRESPEEPLPPVPKYWDFVPKLWWMPAVLAVICRICPYITQLLLISGSGYWPAWQNWLNQYKLTWIFFSPMVAPIVSAIFAAVTVLCFLWALYRFLKARK